MIEAKCTRCQETFIPHSTKSEDLVHGETEMGRPCGGLGIILGHTPEVTLVEDLTLFEKHAQKMPNCDDPDCEFHHPEVREY
jgi:hypothetical protein